MGGEVIIITQDPDLRDSPNPQPIPKLQVSEIKLLYSDYASPAEVSAAVHQVLQAAQNIRGG